MKKSLINITIFFFTLTILFGLVPRVTLHAQTPNTDTKDLGYTGLVQCDGVVNETTLKEAPERNRICNLAALVSMVNFLIRWLFALTIPIFTIMLAISGYWFMTPNPSNRSKAKGMLKAAVTGFVIMLCAWLIVTTLLQFLVSEKFTGADSFIETTK